MTPLLLALLAASDPAPRPVIAVLYFDNGTQKPELDVMRKGLADMLVTDLVAWEGVTVVERTRLEEVLSELKLQQSKAFDAQTAVKVGRLMGAQYQLTGSMLLSGRQLQVDAKLIRLKDGTVVLATRASADQDKIFDLEQDLAAKIMTAIDAKLSPDVMARRKAKVPDLDTLLGYSKAIDLSDQGRLADAQAAMQQIVSKAPSFLLARERREQLLKRFQDYELKKKDLISDSALQLGPIIERALADAPRLDAMDQKEATRFLTLRLLKGRYILRAGKQYFSSRDPRHRVALKGKEAKALLTLRAWLENARLFGDELARTQKRFPGISRAELAPEERKLVEDAKLGTADLVDPWFELVRFVLQGDADDGEGFTVSPALGFADPKERTALLREIDQRIDAAFAAARADPRRSSQLTSLLDVRTRASMQLYDIDGAVSLLQRFLDAFPTSPQAAGYESNIKEWLSGDRSQSLKYMLSWQRGLKGCDGMDLNIGSQSVHDRIEQAGPAGVFAMAAEMEKACARSAKLDHYFTIIYSSWAYRLAQAEDCDGYRALYAKYIACGGSVRSMLYSETQSGCSLGDVKKNAAWFYSQLDRNWSIELDEELASTFDGKTLRLVGRSWLGTPDGRKRQGLDLELSRRDDGTFDCTRARRLRYDGQETDGTCSATVTSLASGKGQFDEGTFDATFLEPWDGRTKRVELTEGVFRMKRR